MISFHIDPATQIVTVTYQQNPSFPEIEKLMKEIFLHKDYKPGFSFIIDRSMLREGPSAEYVENLIKLFKQNEEKMPNSRFAVVVSNSINHGMVRMIQILAEGMGLTIKIFRDIKEAEKWLRSS